MSDISYKIEFHSNWHIGSGLSGNSYADLLVLKNNDHLPIIPGKTLKGLLREAAEFLTHSPLKNELPDDFVKSIFGAVPSDEEKKLEYAIPEGISFFDNANLSEEVANFIKSNKNQNVLYKMISSTALDKEGIAVNNSLRQIEVCVPLTLYGSIYHFPEGENYLKGIAYCFSFIKRLGLQRNRGFGNCTLKLL